jgi:hypothetical protein
MFYRIKQYDKKTKRDFFVDTNTGQSTWIDPRTSYHVGSEQVSSTPDAIMPMPMPEPEGVRGSPSFASDPIPMPMPNPIPFSPGSQSPLATPTIEPQVYEEQDQDGERGLLSKLRKKKPSKHTPPPQYAYAYAQPNPCPPGYVGGYGGQVGPAVSYAPGGFHMPGKQPGHHYAPPSCPPPPPPKKGFSYSATAAIAAGAGYVGYEYGKKAGRQEALNEQYGYCPPPHHQHSGKKDHKHGLF